MNKEKIIKDEFLTIADIYSLLNVSRDYVYKLEKTDPDFPKALKFGTVKRWYKSEVLNYIKNSRKMEE